MDISKLYKIFQKSSGICTDTRKIKSDSIFFALRGEQYDGNDFAQEALDKGALLAVVEHTTYSNNSYWVVNNAEEILQQLAAHHRNVLDIPMIGVAGSNGKTTTKELINAVLSVKYKTVATIGNLNNHIGTPLTLLNITPDTQIAVIEIGANHIGDIAQLCALVNPTHGIITNIGKAHLGTFGGYDNVIREKSELYRHLLRTEGVVFINSHDPVVSQMGNRFRNPIRYPDHGQYYHCELIGADPFIIYKSENGTLVKTQIVGLYNFNNIASALTIGKYFKVDEDKANDAIAAYVPTNLRSQIIQKGSHTIILDAYNANPSSMEAAIENLGHLIAKHKVAVIGDMLDLGDDTDKEHRQIGKLLKQHHFNTVFLCGPASRIMTQEIPQAQYMKTTKELIDTLNSTSFPPSTFLLKASRKMAFEHVVDSIH